MPVYFIVASLFPVLALLANNVGQSGLDEGLRAALVSVLVAGAVFLIGWLLLRDVHRAALLSLLSTFFLFSYGHVYLSLEGRAIGDLVLGRHRFLLPLWLGIAVFAVVLIVRSRGVVRSVTPWLNLSTAMLLAMPVIALITYQVRLQRMDNNGVPDLTKLASSPVLAGERPDVYYIILDAYGSRDGLKNAFGYDNIAFEDALERQGFFVASGSRSNYAQTELSLLSSLEMDYLQTLGHDLCGSCPRAPRIRNAAVVQAFDNLGYKLVALESGYPATEWTDADVYLSRNTSAMSRTALVGGVSDLEALLIRTSIGLAILDSVDVLPRALGAVESGPLEDHRDLLLFQLDQLGRIPIIPGPKFVFAHIVAPHSPYVLDAQGKPVVPEPAQSEGGWLEREARGYTGEVEYLNSRLLEIVDQIQRTSPTPPVIILQGDHGPWVNSVPIRMQILNAYALPGDSMARLYESISPVNSFRVVLGESFGMKLELLEDVSYYSTYPKPYNFEVVAPP